MKNVSVIIPVYGQWDYLDTELSTLSHFFTPEQIFIADDSSVDTDTITYLVDISTKYNVHVNSENLGFGQNVNRAVKRCKTEYVFLVNSDMLFYSNQDVFKNCLNTLKSSKNIGIVGTKLLDSNKNINHAGVYTDYNNPRTPRHISSRSMYDYTFVKDVEYVTGAFWCFRRKDYMDCGGFYDGYGRGYYEDPDLCVVMRRKGKRIVYDGRAYAMHYGHKSFEAISFPYHCTPANLELFWDRCGDLVYGEQKFYERGYKKD